MIAKPKEGAAEQAATLVRLGPPFDPGESGFAHHAVESNYWKRTE